MGRGNLSGQVEGDPAEDDVGGGSVKAVDWVEELVGLEWVGSGFEVWEVVGQVGQVCDDDWGVLVGDFGGGHGREKGKIENDV